jgi:ankyrin repeat protein
VKCSRLSGSWRAGATYGPCFAQRVDGLRQLALSYRYKNYSQTHPKGTTGLHIVAPFGLFIVSNRFLSNHVREAAAAVNKKDSNGQTLLYLATQYGQKGMAELLLDKGAEINA